MYNYALLLHESLKQYEEAKALLTRSLASNPNPAQAECEALLTRVNDRLSLTAQSKQHAETIFGQATVLQQAKQYAEAASKFTEVTRLEPNHPTALGNLAACQRECGMYGSARKNFEAYLAVCLVFILTSSEYLYLETTE